MMVRVLSLRRLCIRRFNSLLLLTSLSTRLWLWLLPLSASCGSSACFHPSFITRLSSNRAARSLEMFRSISSLATTTTSRSCSMKHRRGYNLKSNNCYRKYRRHYQCNMISTTTTSNEEDNNSHHQNFPLNILSSPNNIIVNNWDDRIQLQSQWTLKEKGWNVEVEWKQTPYGIGLFASEDISKGKILRTGILGKNLQQFSNIQDIETFVANNNSQNKNINKEEQQACLRYVKDYLWGFYLNTDDRGYPYKEDDDEERFFGMWIPGNGLNHNIEPNTVYKQTAQGIDLVALDDIVKGTEMFDDYRRHGKSAPTWLLEFASKYPDVVDTLNFADCNEFVIMKKEEKGKE